MAGLVRKENRMKRTMETLVERMGYADEINNEYGYFPVFSGREMGLLEAYLAEGSSDGEGFWRSWSDGSAPKFAESGAYQVYTQNGFYCFSRVPDDQEDAILIKKVVEAIGENKSVYCIMDFIESLKEVQKNQLEGDYELHVVSEFCEANGLECDNFNKPCLEFLGKEIGPYVDMYEGPYGGAFRSEDDLFFYKEGYHIY
jgi:hypothetical protein